MRSALPLLFALAAVGCDEREPQAALEPVDLIEPHAEPRPVTPPADPVLRSRPIMGTIFQISVMGMPEAEADPLIARTFDEIERLEAVLSEWQETSEVSQINARAGGRAVEVSEDTVAVVRAGLDVSRWSNGAFDLSWAALRGLYAFQPGEESVPPMAQVRARLRYVDWEGIELEGNHVRLAQRGMAIGTGGIGKGYALDRAGEVLRAGGAESYMLFGGGQVQVHGMRGNRPWRVGVQHPRDPSSYIGFLEATEGSISTSGDYEHAFLDARGRHWHHIIDLSTGRPATRCMQVTVLADRGVYADALSTAVFILGPEEGLRMLEEIPGHHEAVIIDRNLRVHMTPGTRDRMVMRVTLEGDRLPGDVAFRGWERPAPPVAPEPAEH